MRVVVSARGLTEVRSHDAQADDQWRSVIAAFAEAHGLAASSVCFWVGEEKFFFSKTFVLSREETPRRGSLSNLAGAAFDLLNGTSAPR